MILFISVFLGNVNYSRDGVVGIVLNKESINMIYKILHMWFNIKRQEKES